MSHHPDRSWREREAVRYLDALDAGALDILEAIWLKAESDPELEALLRELEEGLSDDETPETAFQADAARVVGLARQAFPGAFPSNEVLRPLTGADVARRMEAEPEFRRFNAADRLAHARLLVESAVLPEQLGQPALDRWFAGLGVTAGLHYRRAFRKVAVLLTMVQSQREGEGRLAAAREASPKKPRGGPS